MVSAIQDGHIMGTNRSFKTTGSKAIWYLQIGRNQIIKVSSSIFKALSKHQFENICISQVWSALTWFVQAICKMRKTSWSFQTVKYIYSPQCWVEYPQHHISIGWNTQVSTPDPQTWADNRTCSSLCLRWNHAWRPGHQWLPGNTHVPAVRGSGPRGRDWGSGAMSPSYCAGLAQGEVQRHPVP